MKTSDFPQNIQNQIQSQGIAPSEISLEWTAHMKDGTKIHQNYRQGEYNPENDSFSEEHAFKEIDQSQLYIFELHSKDNKMSYQLHFESGEMNFNGMVFRFKPLDLPVVDERLAIKNRELIFFRRQRNDYTPTGVIFRDRYLLGWKGVWERSKVSGQEGKIDENVQFIAVIEEDGSLSFMNRRMLD